MAPDEKKRQPRIPLTPEEVAQLVSLKKMREARKLDKFKRSFSYKAFNIFNICCFFIYWELIFCYLGPCHYQTHYSQSFFAMRGNERNAEGRRIVSELDLLSIDGKKYKFNVDDFIETPRKHSAYEIGKDYILQKELKGIFESSETAYRLQAASPLMFLSVFIIFISCVSFFYNLNQNPHSLTAVAILNMITMLAFITI